MFQRYYYCGSSQFPEIYLKMCTQQRLVLYDTHFCMCRGCKKDRTTLEFPPTAVCVCLTALFHRPTPCFWSPLVFSAESVRVRPAVEFPGHAVPLSAEDAGASGRVAAV